MNRTHFLFKLVLIILVPLACDSSTNEETEQLLPEGELSILPLGDSRVEGARPFHESYRYELWKNMVTEGFDIDLVGPEMDPASYPEFMSRRFDNDHAGIGGDQTTDVLDRLNEVLANTPEPPDIVLLGIGGNDLLDGASSGEVTNNIHTIIDRLQTNNPQVIIFLEQIAPGQSQFMSTQLVSIFNQFNASIPGIASQQSDTSSQVIAVDMSSNWTDDYMADNVHYNEAGAKEVADRYFAAIQNVLNP